MKKEDELTTQMSAIQNLSADMAKSTICMLPYKLDIDLNKSQACIKDTEKEVDEWIDNIKKDNPDQKYIEIKFYEGYLIPVSTDNPP